MIRRSRVRVADQVPNATTVADHDADGSRLELWDRAGDWILAGLLTGAGASIVAGLVHLFRGVL